MTCNKPEQDGGNAPKAVAGRGDWPVELEANAGTVTHIDLSGRT